jgi:hypothetical protein
MRNRSKAAAVVVGALALIGLVGCGSAEGDRASSAPEPEAQFVVKAGKSFALATGVADAWTGDGKIKFYLTVSNTGNANGTFSFTPVRHYDDGDTNMSAMDMSSIDIPAGTTSKFQTDWFKYKAHGHELESAAVLVDGKEIPIKIVH